MLDDDELRELAGEGAFRRGCGYHAGGRVVLELAEPTELRGEAEGQETYRLWLRRTGKGWCWACDCPAAAGGAFCKHLVAAVLTAREPLDGEDANDDTGVADGTAFPGASAARSRRSLQGVDDELAAWLRSQDSDRLAGWLLALAGQDPQVRARIGLYRAAEEPNTLKTALGRVLTVGGFLDYRRSNAYAARLDDALQALTAAVARDPGPTRALCEYVAGRLLRVYARCDDSGGRVGDQLHRVASLHADACTASRPGKALVRPLLALQVRDQWGLFPVSAYWEALGAAGQHAYGNQVVADFDALPPPVTGSRRGASFAIERRTEDYARAAGDLELLLRVLGRHDEPGHHRELIEALREHGRQREALARAEQAVRRFPDDRLLRAALAACLAEAGLDGEALEQAWQAFVRHPSEPGWDTLKQFAGEDWPGWRARALAELAEAESAHATASVRMLMHDGDVDGAADLAHAAPVWVETLAQLARLVEARRPRDAGEFQLRIARHLAGQAQLAHYARIVEALVTAARCLAPESWKPVVASVRAAHARKRKLIDMLDAAAL